MNNQIIYNPRIMKVVCLLFLTFTFHSVYFSQKKLSDLKAEHAAALYLFLIKNPQYGFLSENELSAIDLKVMRKYQNRKLTPFYKTGDFNRDGISDFAVIVGRKDIQPKKDESGTTLYPLTVFVFNGTRRKGFENVFHEDVEQPLYSFLTTMSGKTKELFFAVSESDIVFLIVPNKKSYKVKYLKAI